MGAHKRERIRMLNDRLRRTHQGGKVVLTSGVSALPVPAIAATLAAIGQANEFDERNDPYGEHDFGAVTVSGVRVFWKIDYFDQSMTSHAVDPADPATCVRLMTVMLAEEY